MGIVQNLVIKIKGFRNILNTREDIFIVLLIILVGLGSFALGRLSALEKGALEVRTTALSDQLSAELFSAIKEGENFGDAGFVASINGTKYHAPWCSGAGRIKEENKIWFSSEEEARSAGYGPAANCKGLSE